MPQILQIEMNLFIVWNIPLIFTHNLSYATSSMFFFWSRKVYIAVFPVTTNVTSNNIIDSQIPQNGAALHLPDLQRHLLYATQHEQYKLQDQWLHISLQHQWSWFLKGF